MVVVVVVDVEFAGKPMEVKQDAASEALLQAVVVDGFYCSSFQIGKTD